MQKDPEDIRRIKPTFKKIAVIIVIVLMITAGAYTVYNVITRWIVIDEEIEITIDHPLNDTTIMENATYFNWTGTGGAGALEYVWYIDINNTFTTPFRRAIATGSTSNYTPDPLEDGKWYWRVEATDGSEINVSDTYVLHIITNATNNNSVLSDGNVNPVLGYTSTIFEYTVNFTDADNHSASYVRVYIDEVMHSMTETDPSDTNTTDGKQYNYTTTLSKGWHNYSFTCSDGIGINYTEVYDNPYVNNPPSINVPFPTNNSDNNLITPTCEIYVTDPEGDTFNITFASNYTGGWANYKAENDETNDTFTWSFTGASSYDTTYYWRVYADDGNYNVSRTYVFSTIERQFLQNVTPAYGSANVCPCCDSMCFTITNMDGHLMNITIYRNDTRFNDFYIVNQYANVGNGTYCFCIDGHINNSLYYPMEYNMTYHWYINVTDVEDEISNESAMYLFTTAENPNWCQYGGATGVYTLSNHSFWFFLIMVLVILSLIVVKKRNRLFFKK